ncbi:MAG TPA: hypothetical protein VFR34_05495, partial [Paracoccaceae bacterium]|nr:hypothetical protein [Paracoccaceae bacterium]
MRGDDRLTAILTAMVLVIAIAAFLPREASLARMLGFGAGPVPRDDAFLVAQGGQHRLAVLANDLGVPAPDRAVVAVQSQPACGHARAEAGEVVLSGLEECRGRVGFDYCVAADDSCRSARVVVTIAEAAPEAARAEAEPEVARAEPGQEVVAAAVAAAVVAVPPRVADLVTVAPDSERRLAAASMFDQALPPKPPAGEDPAPARRALPALPPPARLAEAAGTAGIDERPPVSSRALVREPPALVAPAPEAPDARPEAASPSAPPASSER